MKWLYLPINPAVKCLLRSPVHGWMSHNTMVLEYTGRRTGTRYALPVSYLREGETVVAFTARSNLWWRNLRPEAEVTLRLGDVLWHAQGSAHTAPASELAGALTRFPTAVPRDAAPSGVRMHRQEPNPEDVDHAVNRLVMPRFALLGP